MKIRPATKREVAKFFQTVTRTRMRSETELLSPERLEMADECFVAIVNRKIVGAVCIVFDNGEHSELLTEYVLKDYEGHGIGSHLTRAAVERLVELGLAPVYCDVTSEAMEHTFDKLPKKLHRRLRLKRSYLKFGEVELPEKQPRIP